MRTVAISYLATMAVVGPTVVLTHPARAEGTRRIRDAFTQFPAERTALSEHFVLKWGAMHPPTTDEQSELLDALESAFRVQVVEMGFSDPVGDEFLFNVYIDGTGTPIDGAADVDEVPDDLRDAGRPARDDRGRPHARELLPASEVPAQVVSVGIIDSEGAALNHSFML